MRRNQRNKKNIERRIFLRNHYKKTFTFLILLIVALVCTFFVFLFYKNYVENNTPKVYIATEGDISKATQKEEAKDTTFTITALGDILCHNTQYMDAYNPETGEYDFSYCFEDIKYYTQTGDLTIANLETSFAGAERGYSNYPTFNSPDALAYSMKNIGVDIITTAGNHCLDMGYSGLERTIDVLDDADISHLGTYKSNEERDSVFIKYVKGVKIAFIDYTYGTNGIPIPKDKEYCVNLIDKDLIKSDIDAAKAQNAEVIIASMHWGTEYQTIQNSEQEELADFLFQNGVNVIIGNHPHTLQPMEKRTVTLENGSTQDGFVIYALGNFIADQNAENTRNSIILNIKITKHENGNVTIDGANYTPIYMYKDLAATTHKFKLLDIEKTLDTYTNDVDTSIGETTFNYLTTQLNKINSIVGEEF